MSTEDGPMADREMRPADGVVLGRRWGDPPPPDGDRGEAALALLGERWRVAWTYEAGALVAVALDLVRPAAGIDLELVDALDRAARAWLGAPLAARDEAYWAAEGGATRLTWDGLDGRLTFEDNA